MYIHCKLEYLFNICTTKYLYFLIYTVIQFFKCLLSFTFGEAQKRLISSSNKPITEVSFFKKITPSQHTLDQQQPPRSITSALCTSP